MADILFLLIGIASSRSWRSTPAGRLRPEAAAMFNLILGAAVTLGLAAICWWPSSGRKSSDPPDLPPRPRLPHIERPSPMTPTAGCKIALIFAVVDLTAIPIGRYMAASMRGERTFLSPILGPVGGACIVWPGWTPTVTWAGWATRWPCWRSNAAGFVLLYAILAGRACCR